MKRGLFSSGMLWIGHSRAVQGERAVDHSSLQPNITIIERRPQRMSYGSISFPEGSPWCHGNATFWLIGHQLDETPYCYNSEMNNWTTPEIAVLDRKDDLNDLDSHPLNIDRHDCTSLDINKDGLTDIICVVGADKGKGFGYNELYLTQKDGSIRKVLRHGLQKYPTIRSRFVETLHNQADPGNITHVFISAYGTGRDDGEVNWHTMYRLLDGEPYFEHVPGPWNKNAKSRQISVVDWNKDGRDDLIVLHKRNATIFLEQEEGGTFRELDYARSHRNNRMRSARVADMDLDGFPDLIVTTSRFRNKERNWFEPSLKIFKGIDSPQRFNFSSYYFKMTLPFAAPDVEVLDVNSDGIPDLYLVLNDESKESFCGKPMPWEIKPFPPDDWTAPLDEAQDFLLIGRGFQENENDRFERVAMEHKLPGCGFIGKTFGNKKTMILANGDEGHAGTNAILSW